MRWHLGQFLFLLFIVTACQEGRETTPFSGNEPTGIQKVIILATTTSTQDSGLLDVLVPIFEDQSGYVVKVIAVGTGQALRMGESGDADVMLVHAPAAEKVLIENGSAIDRRLIMHNDFVVVGPPDDPAGIRGLSEPYLAFSRITSSSSSFVSRGDDSGTHKKELSIWSEVGAIPDKTRYLESGQGMATTLRIASEKTAYTLTDRATFLAQADTLDLDIMIEGHGSLLNLYHVMAVNPERWSFVNEKGARVWMDFLVSETTQKEIGSFGVEEFGQPLFYPDAGKTESDLQ
ncbi:MAG: substrate-binding domain-containing protein [Candidatus Promineifilaceae bacterium]